MSVNFAFIGFGEAGPLISRGLGGSDDAGSISAYDILTLDPTRRDDWIGKAAIAGARPMDTPKDAVTGADVVISTVTSDRAVDAAASVAPHLVQGQVYLDLNSCSPGKKVQAAVAIENRSAARFVDVAVMDTVPGKGHKVPMLFAGAAAGEVADKLTPFGMRIEVVGDTIGQASTIKMTRSVFMKGIEAILCESLVAAHRAGVHERVLASIQTTFPDLDWRKLATYHMGRMALHGTRRAIEMDSVADTLEELGLKPLTAKGTGDRQMWVAELGLKDRFGETGPQTLESFLEAVDQRDRRETLHGPETAKSKKTG